MKELKPCPFCGESVEPWETGYGVVQVVECKSCKTRFVFPYTRKGHEILEFWNKRAQEDKQC